jgi:hypothetical protein
MTRLDAPVRSRVAGALAAVACAVCCLLPVLVAAGFLTAAGAVVLRQALFAVAAFLVAAALGLWWLRRRHSARFVTVASAALLGSGTQRPDALRHDRGPLLGTKSAAGVTGSDPER